MITFPPFNSNDIAGNPIGSAILSRTPLSSDVLNSISNSRTLPTLKFFSANHKKISDINLFNNG